MARMKRRAQGTTYGKRPVSGTPSAPPSDPGAFSSSDAHSLARQIASEQERYRISSIRLVSAGVCCLIVTDSRTGATAPATYSTTNPDGSSTWTYGLALAQATAEGTYNLSSVATDCASGIRAYQPGKSVCGQIEISQRCAHILLRCEMPIGRHTMVLE